MENIKDFILKADAEEINAAIPVPPPKPKQKVSYETIFASGPDFAVRRRTPKTSMVMVVIVSQGQFYIKDEGAGGTVQNLYENSLTKFVSGIPDEGYRIQTADGNSPNWITTLCRDAGWRDLFLRAITNEDLYPYMKNDMFNIEVIQNSYYRGVDMRCFSEAKQEHRILDETRRSIIDALLALGNLTGDKEYHEFAKLVCPSLDEGTISEIARHMDRFDDWPES